jgi:hypothetical protein
MDRQPYKRVKEMSEEDRDAHRRAQLRKAQLKYRETHGLITVKPKLTEEEKLKIKKEKAHERYLKRRDLKLAEKSEGTKEKLKRGRGIKEGVPESYTVEHRRQYHRQYYEQHKDELQNRCKAYYHKKKQVTATD